jgi:HSP20 family protein
MEVDTMRNLTRWNPRSNQVSDPFRAFEDMFDELWRGLPRRYESDTSYPMLRPAMDVIENDDDYTVRLDLPGIDPNDVKVEIDDHTLTISGEMGDTIERENDRYHYRERHFGAFQRSVRLPNTVDTENIDANVENGVLNIVLPKLPQAQPKQISVKASDKNNE